MTGEFIIFYASDNLKYPSFSLRITDTCRHFTKKILRTGYLGYGSFGIVYTIKIRGKSSLFVEKVFKDSSTDIVAEVRALTLGCEYIPKLIFCGINQDGRWCLVMEYIEGGTLLDHLMNELYQEVEVSPEAKRTIAYQIAVALEFLHARNLTHG